MTIFGIFSHKSFIQLSQLTRYLLLFIGMLCFSCNNYDLPPKIEVTVPINGGLTLTNQAQQKLEGIYRVTKGNAIFGDTLILKSTKNSLSIFGSINGLYAITETLQKDSSVYLYGYWRYALNSETGNLNLKIKATQGGKSIIKANQLSDASFKIAGQYSFGNTSPSDSLVLEYIRPFSAKVLRDEFNILAHRSGGRTSDLLAISENSLAMIGFGEKLGATGIEIDVRLTKDNVPVLYHDEDINIRLTQKSPLNGPLVNYTFAEIARFIRLVNGERIPTLEDALNKVIDSTNLKVVWLDMKAVNNAMARVIPIQQKMLERARQKNRDLAIYIGLPEPQVVTFFKTYPTYQSIPSLCELTPEDVNDINADVWAPRWTLGTMLPQVQKMHLAKRKVFCWTLDNESFIKKYIDEGDFDGILTNYPTIVAYHHYLRK